MFKGFLLIVLLAAPVAPARADHVDVRHGVTYGSGKVAAPAPAEEVAAAAADEAAAPAAVSEELKLDLYTPARRASQRRPLVIVIHGGAFRRGSRADPSIVRIARALAGRGNVVASIDYRLSSPRPIPSARVAPLVATAGDRPVDDAIAAAVDDALSAVDYLRARAGRLRIDLDRLGLVGASAGAITANNVAYVLDDVAIAGPRLRFVASLWGGIPRRRASAGRLGADQLEPGAPALFAVHGAADGRVPVRLSDDLVARARDVGVRAEYHRLAGRRHGFVATDFFGLPVRGAQTAFRRLLAFASAELRQPARRCVRPAARDRRDASRRRCQYPARRAARNLIARSRRAGGSRE
ncbi:MAG: alpha/beta hydrolase [Solirubrobacteraceae bacterium]